MATKWAQKRTKGRIFNKPKTWKSGKNLEPVYDTTPQSVVFKKVENGEKLHLWLVPQSGIVKDFSVFVDVCNSLPASFTLHMVRRGEDEKDTERTFTIPIEEDKYLALTEEFEVLKGDMVYGTITAAPALEVVIEGVLISFVFVGASRQ